MNPERVLIKYHEGREWVKPAELGPHAQHEFAQFFAESDWDDPQAAWREFRARS